MGRKFELVASLLPLFTAAIVINEKHLSETGGKLFLTLTATGWDKRCSRFTLKAAFSEVEDSYRFEGTIDLFGPKTINSWKISKAKS
jgi:hypothetical protein